MICYYVFNFRTINLHWKETEQTVWCFAEFFQRTSWHCVCYQFTRQIYTMCNILIWTCIDKAGSADIPYIVYFFAVWIACIETNFWALYLHKYFFVRVLLFIFCFYLNWTHFFIASCGFFSLSCYPIECREQKYIWNTRTIVEPRFNSLKWNHFFPSRKCIMVDIEI